MGLPHPSLTLILDVDERLKNDELKLEVSRCFTHVAQTLLRYHEASEGEPENTARFLIRMGQRKYLKSSDEGADELWREVMERWIYNELYNVSNNMRIFNRRQSRIGNDELAIKWYELEFENGALTAKLRCETTNAVEPDKAAKAISELRQKYSDGALGDGVTSVVLPDEESYEAQKVAGEKAKQEAEERRREEEAAKKEQEAKARIEAEHKADEDFLESPELTKEASAQHGFSVKKARGLTDEVEPMPRDEREGLRGDNANEAAADEAEADKTAANATADNEAGVNEATTAAAGGQESTPDADTNPAEGAADQVEPDQEEADQPEAESDQTEDETDGEDYKKIYELKQADFPLTYDIWQVNYENGSSRVYDARVGSFQE